MSQIKVRDSQDNPVPGVNIRVSQGHADSDAAIFDIQTDESGTQGWPIPFWPVSDYTLHINFRGVLDGYEAKSVFISRPANGQYGDVIVELGRVTKVSTLSRLHTEGTFFLNEHGERVFLKGATFFSAYWQFLEKGPDSIRPALAELQALGCNMIRVFGMSHYVQANLFGATQFNPSHYGDMYFSELPSFYALAAEYGMYVYLSVFPDNDLINEFRDSHNRIVHWNKLIDALKPLSNGLLEVTNEPDGHSFNYVDPFSLTFPSFCPACPGSYGESSAAYASGIFPPGSNWGGNKSFGDLHPRREYPAEIMDSMAVNNVYFMHNRAIMIGEPDRFGSRGNPDSDKARLTGAAGAVGAVGIVFHSIQGQKCEVFDEVTRKCAVAFFGALKAV